MVRVATVDDWFLANLFPLAVFENKFKLKD